MKLKMNDGKYKGMSQPGLVIFCGFLLTISGFSVDVMLPAFLPMAHDLNANISTVQGTIPVFMISFAIAQVIYGPASDKYGRRPIIALGLLIFLSGAVIAAMGTTISQVLIGRAVQGFGAAAGPVIARAILRDTHSGQELARALATSMGIFAIGPILAPLVGFSIQNGFGWRYIFIAMGALAFTLIGVNWLRFKETNPSLNPNALQFRNLASAIGQLLRHPQSRLFLVLSTMAYCALLSYVANAPRIYDSAFDVREGKFAVLFALTGIGIIVGQIGNRAILPRLGILNTLRLAGFILFAASAGNVLFALAGYLNAIVFSVLMFFFNTSFLVVVSNTLTLISDPHPKIAGLVSAFFGFVTTGISALFVALTFDIFDGDLLAWGLGMMVTTGLPFLGFLLIRPRHITLNEG